MPSSRDLIPLTVYNSQLTVFYDIPFEYLNFERNCSFKIAHSFFNVYYNYIYLVKPSTY